MIDRRYDVSWQKNYIMKDIQEVVSRLNNQGGT